MLSSASVTTMLPVKDIDRARAFYEGCLGLKPGGFRADGKFVYVVGGSTLALFPKPEGTKADHTAISFRVDDIAASIGELKRAGVVFEDRDRTAANGGTPQAGEPGINGVALRLTGTDAYGNAVDRSTTSGPTAAMPSPACRPPPSR